MQAWILQVMGQYGALGIFFLIFIENVFPPIPSEVILAFGGFMTLQTTLSVQSVILAATLGSVAVSYTHLDVYKRQAQARTLPASRPKRCWKATTMS